MKVPTLIRLDPDVRDALDRLAQRESRSLSSMVQVLIKSEAIKQGCYVMPPLKTIKVKSER